MKIVILIIAFVLAIALYEIARNEALCVIFLKLASYTGKKYPKFATVLGKLGLLFATREQLKSLERRMEREINETF